MGPLIALSSGYDSSMKPSCPPDVLIRIQGDLRSRGIDPERLTVVSVTARTWRDGSLGCPEPGMFYTQALVEGHRVVVEIDGITHDYRVGGGRVRLCPGDETDSHAGEVSPDRGV